MNKLYFSLILFLVCQFNVFASDLVLVDKNATQTTKALFSNLKKIQEEGKVLLGHQDATLYGRTWVGDKDRSDIKDVTGSHPAVIGLDFAKVTSDNSEIAENAKTQLVTAVKETYKRGGVVTFAWHMSNPANEGSFYWEKKLGVSCAIHASRWKTS